MSRTMSTTTTLSPRLRCLGSPGALAAAAIFAAAGTAHAQEINLCYGITDLQNGLFEYRFWLAPGSGWQPGMGWGGLVIGDERSVAAGGTGVSPLADLTMDPGQFPVGPWTSLTPTSGAHNGPTFDPASSFWTPVQIKHGLTWSAQSATRVEPGELLFSTLTTEGGAEAAEFKVASFGGKTNCLCACNYCTITGMGVCDVKDFLAFQSGFVRGDPGVCDIDMSTGVGVCDIFDFLAFQNDFVAGCP